MCVLESELFMHPRESHFGVYFPISEVTGEINSRIRLGRRWNDYPHTSTLCLTCSVYFLLVTAQYVAYDDTMQLRDVKIVPHAQEKRYRTRQIPILFTAVFTTCRVRKQIAVHQGISTVAIMLSQIYLLQQFLRNSAILLFASPGIYARENINILSSFHHLSILRSSNNLKGFIVENRKTCILHSRSGWWPGDQVICSCDIVLILLHCFKRSFARTMTTEYQNSLTCVLKENFDDNNSKLDQAMVWYLQATRLYLIQHFSRFIIIYGVSMP